MNRCSGSLLMVMLLVVACDGSDEAARPAPTKTSFTTTSVAPASPTATIGRSAGLDPSCRVPPRAQPSGSMEIRVFFHCGGGGSIDPLVPVVRYVLPTTAVLQAAVEAWARGSTEEEMAAGMYGGIPSEASAAAIRVSLRDGVAGFSVDYDLNSVGNFTTSNVTARFYGGLWANAFQFPAVDAVVVEGQCPGEVSCSETVSGPRTEPVTRSEWPSVSRKACPPSLPAGSLCVR